MKNLIFTLLFLISFTAQATIEYLPEDQSKATPGEIYKNRACFEELATHGCGSPGDDKEHFRKCLKTTYSSLTNDCQSMMSSLYGE